MKLPFRKKPLGEFSRVSTPETSVGFRDYDDLSIEELLTEPVTMRESHFTEHRIAPTSLDPTAVLIEDSGGVDYSTSALLFLETRYEARLKELDLILPYELDEAIRAEIAIAHTFQVTKNTSSMNRILEALTFRPELISQDLARMVHNERRGEGSTEERLHILSNIPSMESIEDMKITEPLNGGAILEAMAQYYSRLHAIADDPTNGIELEFIDHKQQRFYMVDASKTALPGVIVTKKVPVVARVGDVELELKQKDSYAAIPDNAHIKEGVPRYIVPMHGVEAHWQHISSSAYWVVKSAS